MTADDVHAEIDRLAREAVDGLLPTDGLDSSGVAVPAVPVEHRPLYKRPQD